jgi:peptidoglycan hydrolase-like protein with peptidoglycan-binding domain
MPIVNRAPSTQIKDKPHQLHKVNIQPTTPPPSAAPPAPVVFNKTLSYGSSGTAVANVQQFLADEGFYSGRDTGIFDQATVAAVIAFQQRENLTPASGIFGQAEQGRANTIIAVHPDWVTTLSNNNQYQNVNGSPVQSPAYSTNGVPAGATAICGDGTYSFSMHRSGTCSHHGGVSEWLQ